jgi:hypothetical protein
MKSFLAHRIGVVAMVSLFQLRTASLIPAAERLVAIQGEVTSVADDLNWFNDSIQVGMPVAGSYNFFDAGYVLGTYIGDSSELTYEYLLQPDPNFNLPVLPVNMHLAIGGHDYNTAGPNPIRYAINVFNDSNGFVVGDAYQVQSPLPFPAHFTDWVGDPVNDPDGIFSPFLFMTLELRDPTATALSSTDLPLVPPPLAGFASALGRIYIADFNGEPDYAVAEFEITSLQLVPEPSSLAACAVGILCLVTRTRVARHRRDA